MSPRDGAALFFRARRRTLAIPGIQLALRAPRSTTFGRRRAPAVLCPTPVTLLDSLVGVERVRIREIGIVRQVLVTRFSAHLGCVAPTMGLAADVWIDEDEVVRRITAVPARGRGSARWSRLLHGRIPLDRAWRVDVIVGGQPLEPDDFGPEEP